MNMIIPVIMPPHIAERKGTGHNAEVRQHRTTGCIRLQFGH